MLNAWFFFVLAFTLGFFVLDLWVEKLNLRSLSPEIPGPMRDVFDQAAYEKSQTYLKTTTEFHLLQRSFGLVLFLLFWWLGGFVWFDQLARSTASGPVLQGLIFFGVLGLSLRFVNLPFSVYDTFVIEERFGFNRTTPVTFVKDLFRGLALGALIGGLALGSILLFFETLGTHAWWVAWIAVTIYQMFLLYVAPTWIMPLFNKFEPLEPGPLKEAIETFAEREAFEISGLFKMDGSKRSSKSNAFFTGFGKNRRIVLFDTLIEQHSTEELVAVLAHEIGHYKKKHILKMLVLSIGTTGLMFYFLGLLMNQPSLFAAFGMDQLSVYASLCFAGIIYQPFSRALGALTHYLSRVHEFEADRYAAEKYGKPESLVSALKKLSKENLSNLTPHPLKVFLDYTHPPVIQRIQALEVARS